MPTTRQPRILIVENDPDTRENVRDILELDNYQVILAGSAQDALDLTEGESISVVILAPGFPDAPLEELIPQIRSRAPEAAIIIVTSYADLNGAVAALRLGAANYILKPINPDALRSDLTRIVEHQRAKSELRDQYARMQAVFNSAVEGIITIDEVGTIESFNPAAEAMFGYTADEVAGRNISMLMPAPYAAEHDQYLENFRRTGERKIIGTGREVTAQRRNGETFPIHLSVSEVHLDDRRLFTGMVRDITELKQAEERLLQAERLAGIGQAMAALAHESRNALQRSQAGLEMLARRVEDQPEATQLIRRIQRAQDDLHQLYEDVREYAAPIRLAPKQCRISEIVHLAWQNLTVVQEGRSAELIENGENVQCEVDPFSMRLVFQNIFDNSLTATTDDVEVHVEYSYTTLASRPAVKVRVCDDGPGLTPEAERRIFEEFYTNKTRGTGLGMAICQRIVIAHGGTIAADSPPDRGTCITIILPRSQS